MSHTLQELADLLGGVVHGDASLAVSGLGSLDDASEGQITFLANPKYAEKVSVTKASAVVLPPGAQRYGKHAIEVKNPYLAFAKLLTLFYVRVPEPQGVMAGALVGKDVSLGDGVTVFPGAVIGNNVRIGNRTIIHRNSVVGSDGFGYAPDGEEWYKIPQIGIVVIEDDVEIGAGVTIDRAALDVTVIGKGTKIDNLVQIAHNCRLGENCMIVAQVGIAGSVKLGKHVTVGGQAGFAGHLSIGDNAMVGGQSGVMGDVPAGSLLSGTPAIPHRDYLRASTLYGKLPEMRKTLQSLEKRIVQLEAQLKTIEPE
jgi:UDP-3-O-[3-hydroxymyristoyl] glucosamine N-acyltransferase